MNSRAWESVRDRLLALDWVPTTSDGLQALNGPRQAAAIRADQVTDEALRDTMKEVLRRKILSLEKKPPTGVPAGWVEEGLVEFRQLLDALVSVDE